MDSRDLASISNKWYKKIDERAMRVAVEIYDNDGDSYIYNFPMRYEVCHLCEGRGRHVNPSIDSHGISSEEFYEDPDFAEEYFSGSYDVSCYECQGKKVVPSIEVDMLSKEDMEHYFLYEEMMEHRETELRQRAYEIRMGY